MYWPKVSVVIPSINNELQPLITSIQSVLNQSYENFEVIVVGKSSPQSTLQLDKLAETKIKFIPCQDAIDTAVKNIGLAATKGDLVFFLLPGDKYHPDKIREHVLFRDGHPDVIMTYNFHHTIGQQGEILHQSRDQWAMSFADQIISIPITLSDIVFRKDWLQQYGAFDIHYSTKAGDVELMFRFILGNNKIAPINRPLNYNRYDQDFPVHHVSGEFDEMICVLTDFFASPRCPQELRIKQNAFSGKLYGYRACLAFLNADTSNGQELMRKSIWLDRSILDNHAEEFFRVLTILTLPYGDGFEVFFRDVMDQMPPELAWISVYCDQSVAREYLLSGISDILWNRTPQALNKFEKALMYEIHLDFRLLVEILEQTSIYEDEYGPEAAQSTVYSIGEHLRKIGKRKEANWFVGTFFINQAFKDYRDCRYNEVRSRVLQAIKVRPTLLINRGVLSIFLRSLQRI